MILTLAMIDSEYEIKKDTFEKYALETSWFFLARLFDKLYHLTSESVMFVGLWGTFDILLW